MPHKTSIHLSVMIIHVLIHILFSTTKLKYFLFYNLKINNSAMLSPKVTEDIRIFEYIGFTKGRQKTSSHSVYKMSVVFSTFVDRLCEVIFFRSLNRYHSLISLSICSLLIPSFQAKITPIKAVGSKALACATKANERPMARGTPKSDNDN